MHGEVGGEAGPSLAAARPPPNVQRAAGLLGHGYIGGSPTALPNVTNNNSTDLSSKRARALGSGVYTRKSAAVYQTTIPRTATTIPPDKNNSFQKAVPPNGSNNSAKNTFRSPRCHFTHGGYHTVVPSLDNELWGRESTTHCVHWLFIWFGACPSNPVTAACSLSFEFQVPHCHIIVLVGTHKARAAASTTPRCPAPPTLPRCLSVMP